jgi:hypothetical protein
MQKINHSELAKRLILRAIENYKNKFILEEDLFNGEDRRKIIKEVENIEKDIKNNRVKQLEDMLHCWCSEERDEEFEL